MKFGCQCGQSIIDQTDFLPYKANLLADQDRESMIEEIEAHAAKLVSAMKNLSQAESVLPQGDPLETFSKALWLRIIPKYLSRVIYQCLNCGRIFIENSDHRANLHSFVPDDQSWEKLLGSING